MQSQHTVTPVPRGFTDISTPPSIIVTIIAGDRHGRYRRRAQDARRIADRPFAVSDRLPWDRVNVTKGRPYLEKEQNRAVVQLAAMAGAE